MIKTMYNGKNHKTDNSTGQSPVPTLIKNNSPN